MQNFGILHPLQNLGMLFNCLAFPKVATFTCSFDFLDVSVPVLNTFFVRGRCRRFESCWVHSAPPINLQEAPCDVFSMPFLFWSRGVNVWPCSLLNRLQNYTPSRSVKSWAATQQGLSDKATTGETLLSHVSHFQHKNRYIIWHFLQETTIEATFYALLFTLRISVDVQVSVFIRSAVIAIQRQSSLKTK